MRAPTLASAGSGLVRARLRAGSILGISISLHWSWLAYIAIWIIRNDQDSTVAWGVGQLIATFVIVLLHEMGHAAAAKRLGHTAKEIILWPLGGFALVSPIPHWKDRLIFAAAGPLVNLVLAPVIFLAWYQFGYRQGGNVSQFLWNVAWINLSLLGVQPVADLASRRGSDFSSLHRRQARRVLEPVFKWHHGSVAGKRRDLVVPACGCVHGGRSAVIPLGNERDVASEVSQHTGIRKGMGLARNRPMPPLRQPRGRFSVEDV